MSETTVVIIMGFAIFAMLVQVPLSGLLLEIKIQRIYKFLKTHFSDFKYEEKDVEDFMFPSGKENKKSPPEDDDLNNS